MQQVTEQVLKRITPTNSDRANIEAIAREIEEKVSLACKEEGVPAIVRVEGSIAKDTWLKENPDIDVFMRLPTSIPRKSLGEVGLKIAKKAAGQYKQLERFAEHPYLEITVDEYQVDIVPCYNAKPGEWQSATDRTPYHTDYIKKHLTTGLHGEVRLLKRFMQGIGVYGAEIKVGGFSGYLCELLILKYGSFSKTIETFAHYTKRVIVDLEGYYVERQKDLQLLFFEPLVIVDPVDKARNVASAVQPDKLYTFIAAARAFAKKPDEAYFYPPKTKALPTEKLRDTLECRGSTAVFLAVDQLSAVPDVLWGQLYRTQRSLHKLIELSDFKILKEAVWSNEATLSVFVFELQQQVLPEVKKHLGPPLEREAECESFLAKYAVNSQVISGPFVEDGRWVVTLPRKNIDITALLQEKLADGGKKAGVADLIVKSIQKNLKILVNDEVTSLYQANNGFAVFLTEFLIGKPLWLQ